MAGQQYRRPPSPGRAKRGFSDASLSLSPLGGSAPGSALGQNSDLLGLPGPGSMSFDYSSIPRTLSSTIDFTSRGSNNPYNTTLFLDGDSNGQKPASSTPTIPWSGNYSLQPGNTNITAASASPITRFQSEAQASWDPLRIVPPPRPTSGTAHTQQKLGHRPGPTNRFPPGPDSDLVSRTNETDEGYYTNSQLDAQSVHSMNMWNMNQGRQNMQPRQMVAPLAYSHPGPGNHSSEQPDSDMQHGQTTTNHAVQSQHGSNSLFCTHEECDHESRTQSEFKKHAARHNKEHVCEELGCTRTEGFATINDLERHQKSVHKIQPAHGQSREYKCFGNSCPKHEREWPRFDNFKQHLKRMHENESIEMLISKSKEWYERHKKPQAKPDTRASQQPSSSSSPQAPVQSAVQTGAQFFTPGQRNQRASTNQGRIVNTTPPNRTFGINYTQSEVGYCRSNISGSNNSQSMSRPSTGHMQFQSNFVSSPNLRSSQAFISSDPVREREQLQHTPQNMLTPYYIGTQNRDSSESNQGNQATLIPGHFVPRQRFAGTAARVQSLDQPQMRAANMGYGTRTAPGSIEALPYRLEDFDNTPMTYSQDPHFATGNSDNDLVQIGTLDQFSASISQPADSGSASFHRQTTNLGDDTRTEQVSPVSIDSIKSFLRQHANQASSDRIDSTSQQVERFIQSTLQSLQSSSSNGELSNVPAPASQADMDNFKTSEKDGKTRYHCPYLGCKKDMPRKCELRKHLQRHTLPWACTFDVCRKPCGSKNDWKRHETRLHEQQECWRCEEVQSNESGQSVPSSGEDACKRLFCTKELYLKHLQDQHKILEVGVRVKLCKTQRIGGKCRVQYWCGFCNKIITMRAIGVEGDTERWNHIDQHFTKEKLKIAHWKALNGQPVPGDSAMESGHTSPSETSCGGCTEEEGDEEAAADANIAQSGSRKRPASMVVAANQGPASKVARSVGSRSHIVRTQMIKCCDCFNVFQPWNGACINCNHQVCPNCSTELVQQMEQI